MTFLVIGIGLVNAQISKVTGTVTSEEDGLPVVGASVLVKGTTVGTVTDIDGNFTINNVPSSAKTLVISFIGLQSQEVDIKPVVKIMLKSDSEQLDEVMVVAYGTAKKSSFTGSATSIKSEQITSGSRESLDKAFRKNGRCPCGFRYRRSGFYGRNEHPWRWLHQRFKVAAVCNRRSSHESR